MTSDNRIWVLISVLLLGSFLADSFCQTKIDSLKQLLGSKKAQDKYVVFRQLAEEYQNIDPAKATGYADDALKIAQDLNDEIKIAESLQFAAACKSRAGDYPTALKDLKLALYIYKELNNEEKASFVSGDLAWVNSQLKRYDEALSIYTQLLSYYYRINKMNRYCSLLNNIGVLLAEKGEYSKALENYKKILEIYPKISPVDKGYMAAIYCNIGEAYFGLKDYGQSFKYRKISLDLFKELKDRDGVANMQMDLGASLTELKDYRDAKVYLDEALANYTSIKYAEGIRKTKEKFVVLYKEMHQYDKALTACKELEGLSIGSKDSTMLVNCYSHYADIYFAFNDYKPAAGYFKKYISLKEQFDIKENKQRMMELQTLFETEEKEFENKTLRQENELQKEKLNAKENMLIAVSAGIVIVFVLLFVLHRKEKKFRKINEELKIQNLRLEEHVIAKDKFFSILAHNLKNPFWAILAQNKLLEESYNELTDDERTELIGSIGNSATNVYKLFEDLLRWAKSQRNGIELEIKPLQLSELIRTSIKPYEMIARNKKVELEIRDKGGLQVKGDQFMLETVVGNLVDNAIKYSNQNGKVIVENRIEGNNVEISVKDFGIGMSRDKISRLFKIEENVSSAGTMNEKGTGFGLLICKEFVEKHNGSVVVESEEEKGTTFKVILPQG